MVTERIHIISRRRFVQTTFAAFAASGVASSSVAWARTTQDSPDTHNMLVVGGESAFLSHLPMFHGLDSTKKAFSSAHRYQVILEASFTHQGENVTDLYFRDRRAHPEARIYTLNPREFVLPQVFTPREKPRLRRFTAKLFRGHLEHGGELIGGLEEVDVNVTRVVHGRMLEPHVKKPVALEYLLFGKGSELFLAHAIFAPPDFDQVLSVKITGGVALEAADLAQEIRVTVLDRKNVVRERLREKQRFDAMLQIGRTGAATSKVQLETGPEIYFEEGELLVPPTFDPTAEEKKMTQP